MQTDKLKKMIRSNNENEVSKPVVVTNVMEAKKPAPSQRKSQSRTIETPVEIEEYPESNLFDITAEGVIYPKRSKRGGKTEKHLYASVYLPESEYKRLEALAEKHHMTTSNFIRILILNSV